MDDLHLQLMRLEADSSSSISTEEEVLPEVLQAAFQQLGRVQQLSELREKQIALVSLNEQFKRWIEVYLLKRFERSLGAQCKMINAPSKSVCFSVCLNFQYHYLAWLLSLRQFRQPLTFFLRENFHFCFVGRGRERRTRRAGEEIRALVPNRRRRGRPGKRPTHRRPRREVLRTPSARRQTHFRR